MIVFLVLIFNVAVGIGGWKYLKTMEAIEKHAKAKDTRRIKYNSTYVFENEEETVLDSGFQLRCSSSNKVISSPIPKSAAAKKQVRVFPSERVV